LATTIEHDQRAATTRETALGWLLFVWRGKMLESLSFGGDSFAESLLRLPVDVPIVPHGTPDQRRLMGRLARYFAGHTDDFRDVRLDVSDLTPFQRRVVRQCRRIPPGRTRTYGQLARSAGSPAAARAVGSVMRRNRWPIIVPCHRVVGSGGSLGGYSGPGGLDTKRRLLRLEGSLPACGLAGR